MTIRVHGDAAYHRAIEASEILFGKDTAEQLMNIEERDLLDIFEGVPQYDVAKSELVSGIQIIDLLAQKSKVFQSNGEARRMLQSNAVSINKLKVAADKVLCLDDLIKGKYILVQKGKKNYFLLKVV